MWSVPTFFDAFAWGLISAVSLPLGAVIGLYVKNIGKKVCAAMMAFGGGALLFALSIDLFGVTVSELYHEDMDAHEKQHVKMLIMMLITGAIAGGLAFEFLSAQLNSRGAFFRKLFAGIRRVSEMKWLFVYRAVKELQDLDLLHDIPQSDVEDLVYDMNKENLQEGDVIFNDIDSYTPIYFVTKGKVKLLFEAEGDYPALEIIYKRHQVFGGLTARLSRPCRATASALSDVELLTLQPSKIAELVSKKPSLKRVSSDLSISSDDSTETEPEIEIEIEGVNTGTIIEALDEESNKITPKDGIELATMSSLGDVPDHLPNDAAVSPSKEEVQQSQDPVLALRNAHLRYHNDGSSSSSTSSSSSSTQSSSSEDEAETGRQNSASAAASAAMAGGENPEQTQGKKKSRRTAKSKSQQRKKSDENNPDQVVVEMEDNHQNQIQSKLEESAAAVAEVETPTTPTISAPASAVPIRIRANHTSNAAQIVRARTSSNAGGGPPPTILPPTSASLRAHNSHGNLHSKSGSGHASTTSKQHPARIPVPISHKHEVHEGVEELKRAQSAALSIWLGILIDGIPESLTIGILALDPKGMSLSFIVGIFLSNFPEALSSSVSMKASGLRKVHIMGLWLTILIITGLGAGIGACVFSVHPSDGEAYGVHFIEGLASGAMLTMIAKSCLPEAHEQGGGIIGFMCLLGFLASLAVKLF